MLKILPLLLTLAPVGTLAAEANPEVVVYRCKGDDGIINYRTLGGPDCVGITRAQAPKTRWRGVSIDESRAASIDTESIVRSGTKVEVWVSYWYPAGPMRLSSGKYSSRTLERTRIDCSTRSSALLSSIDYDADGGVIASPSYISPSYAAIAPDTIGEAVLKEVCP